MRALRFNVVLYGQNRCMVTLSVSLLGRHAAVIRPRVKSWDVWLQGGADAAVCARQ